MKRLPPVEYTTEARRDFDRCRHFLRRHSPDIAWRRTRELISAIRRIRESPEINPVRKIDPETGLHLRRRNVARLTIVYVYFPPTTSKPNGVVSLRAFRHAAKEDVFWEVRERTPTDIGTQERQFLSTGVDGVHTLHGRDE